MVRFADFQKFLVCTMVAFILGSCTQRLQGHRRKTLDEVCFSSSDRGAEPNGAQDSSPSCPVERKEAGEALASYERKLARDEDGRAVTLTELARLCFVIGQLEEGQEGESYYEKGRDYANLLSREQPRRVEGHYWLALNLAGLAEVGRAGHALRLLPTIVERLETALSLDETYDQGGPHRILGCIFCEAPRWPLSEGDLKKAMHHLRTAVEIAPENSTNHLYLARTLIELDKYDEAKLELERVLISSQHSISAYQLASDHQKARDLMKRLNP